MLNHGGVGLDLQHPTRLHMMVLSNSGLFELREIEGAGRGLLASHTILKDALILSSPRPAAHVIFRQYRKEVCAHCFHYDRGRTLPVRDNSTGKVFCSQECHAQWSTETTELGVGAWQSLESFFKANSRNVANMTSEMLAECKPDETYVKSAWDKVGVAARMKTGGRAKQIPALSIEPDILGLLLSAILLHHLDVETWKTDVMALSMDPEPYKTKAELDLHCSSLLKLATILPRELSSSCTPEVCYTVACAGNHNAFGIRSGSEDGEEYMGYSIYPEASYFNHSCVPNVRKKQIRREWRFHAAREIEQDEELCISYLGGDEKDLTVTERRERLQSVWGFTCSCLLCMQESGES